MFQNLQNTFRCLLALVLVLSVPMSCSWIADDRSECPYRIQLQALVQADTEGTISTSLEDIRTFSFYVFGADGKFVVRQEEDGEKLKQNNYVVELPVPAGNYEIVVWAGSDDEHYRLTELQKDESRPSHLALYLERDADGWQRNELPPLWHGHLALTNVVEGQALLFPLTLDTHVLAITLEEPATTRGTEPDYTFELIAANGYLGYDNYPLEDTPVHYGAYHAEGNGGRLSTLRLLAGEEACCVIRHRASGNVLIDTDLTEYLLRTRPLYEQKHQVKLTNQEYLDRVGIFDVTFYLDSSHILVALRINGWMIRLNDAEL